MGVGILLHNSTWPPDKDEYTSAVVLSYDNWNDYNYRTLFHAFFCDIEGEVHPIGDVKIYNYHNDEARSEDYRKHTRHSLGKTVEQLPDGFCSLGQDLTYYRKLKEYFPLEYIDILRRLKDIATNPSLQHEFLDQNGVQTSLLRFSGAEKALVEASLILGKDAKVTRDMSFKFRATMPYRDDPVDLHFNFAPSNDLPYRINAIIGKNGTGKTQILAKLADALSGFADERNLRQLGFPAGRPPVDRVISISYSAFDCFKKPKGLEGRDNKRALFSYVYCGIQSENGTLSLAELRYNFSYALKQVKEKDRYEIWKRIMSELIESEHAEILETIESGDSNIEWSSGQHIIISTMTELIANIEPESIILFDEPEIHLHPNAIANLMRMVNDLLCTFDSYAIFCTHSPIIIQEIPSDYVVVLDRIDGTLSVRRPEVECLGANISDIISDVFDVSCYCCHRLSGNRRHELSWS